MRALRCADRTLGASLVTLARKRMAEAKGLDVDAKKVVWEDALKILLRVPVEFEGERPAVARAHLEMGRLHRRLGQAAEARRAFEAAVAFRDVSNVACDAMHDLVSVLRREKEYEAADAILLDLVKSFPEEKYDRAKALDRLASSARKRKEYEEAEGYLRQVLMEHGDLWRPAVDALDDLVTVLLLSGRGEEARRVLEAEREALLERFSEGRDADRVAKALDGMRCLARLAGAGSP